MSLKIWLLAAAAIAPATAAYAQTSAPAQQPRTPPPAQRAPAQTPPEVQGVTVTGTAAPVRSSVDRLSYSLANDLQTTTGSVADALRNVPGVEVDPQGNVSLRGDPNVTILVDGRPSALFKGESRADALQQMGAENVERVEVITNPSAAMSPEGTAGVINLVTKKTRKAGKTGTVRASVGTEGRANVGLSGSYTGTKLTVSGNAGYRKQGGEFTEERVRELLNPATGALLGSTRTTTLSNQKGGGFANARLGVDYDASQQDRLSIEASLFSFGLKPDGATALEFRDAAGLVTRSTNRLFENEFGNENKSLRVSWRHRFAGGQTGNEHELTADATHDMFDNFNDAGIREVSVVPTGPDAFERNRNTIDRDEDRVKFEYARPMAGDQKLRLGYEGAITEVAFNFERRRGASPSVLPVDPIFSNAFEYEQDVHAVYGTYERPHGDKLTVQYGLRLEQVNTVASSTTQPPFGLPFNPRGTNDYFRVYPTINLGYELDESRRVRAGYSRRVQRPQPFDLNPFPVFIDEQHYRTGNPDLDPEITDSFEAAFQYRRQTTFYLATLFYRQASGGITDVLIPRPGGVFETTRANLAESRRVGLELIANGRITPKLTYNASATVQQVEIEPTGFFGITEPRSGTSISGRLSLNWNPTDKDFFQLGGFMQGEQLLAQGVKEPMGMLNFGYRRKVDEKLSLVFSAQNILDSFNERVRYDTPSFRDRGERRFLAPAAFVGFIYNFGDGTQRRRPEPTFEFEQQGGAPPG